jgi:hypothetical protein
METPSGATYFFGDTLDSLLTSMEPKHVSVWKIVAGGVLAAGGDHLPDVNDLLRHSAATAGTSAFGLPRLPDDHLPSILPRAAVERFWPGAPAAVAVRSAAMAAADGPCGAEADAGDEGLDRARPRRQDRDGSRGADVPWIRRRFHSD